MFSVEKIRQGGLIFAWGLYDLANQSFAVNVVSLYFVRWLTLEKGAQEILYSLTFGISTFFIAVFAPLLGAISDETKKRRPFLSYLTILSVVFTVALGFCKSVFAGLLFFAIANFGCQTAVVFYNAQLVDVAPRGKIGLVSGIGRMLGYSGAILALLVIRPVVLEKGYQATFVPSGFLFFLLSLPCLIFVKDKPSEKKADLFGCLRKEKLLLVFKNLKITVEQAQGLPGLSDFFKSCFFSLCGVNAVILFMSVYMTKVFGLNEAGVIDIILFSTLFAIASSFFSGLISDYIGNKRSLIAALVLWIICFLAGAFVRSASFYWLIGAMVGVGLGAIWVVCRSFVIQLVPAEKTGEVFGLFGLIGYLSSITGAIFWGTVLVLFSGLGQIRYRIALLSLALFMLLGLVFLLRIKLSKFPRDLSSAALSNK